jgi:hypothetical protein
MAMAEFRKHGFADRTGPGDEAHGEDSRTRNAAREWGLLLSCFLPGGSNLFLA